jgi:hypothetical protein
MNADDGWFGMNVAHHKRHRTLNSYRRSWFAGIARLRIGDNALESKDPKVAPACGEICICNLFYAFKRHRLHYTNAGDHSFPVTKELQDNDEIVTRKMQERKVKG